MTYFYASCLLFFCSTVFAQSTDKILAIPSGSTVGIIQAVMGNGDLVPARFARVLALSGEAAEIKPRIEAIASAIEKTRTAARSDSQRKLAELECLKSIAYIQPVVSTLRRVSLAVISDADEHGEFELAGLSKHPYTILAIGRVGMNAAIWLHELDASKQQSRLKLTRPIIACFDPETFIKF